MDVTGSIFIFITVKMRDKLKYLLSFNINRITEQQACITNSRPVISEKEKWQQVSGESVWSKEWIMTTVKVHTTASALCRLQCSLYSTTQNVT